MTKTSLRYSAGMWKSNAPSGLVMVPMAFPLIPTEAKGIGSRVSRSSARAEMVKFWLKPAVERISPANRIKIARMAFFRWIRSIKVSHLHESSVKAVYRRNQHPDGQFRAFDSGLFVLLNLWKFTIGVLAHEALWTGLTTYLESEKAYRWFASGMPWTLPFQHFWGLSSSVHLRTCSGMACIYGKYFAYSLYSSSCGPISFPV